MAERRMFAKSIIDSDAFLDMPLSTQAMYFHLGMRADDDGFVNNPKKIMRMVNTSEDDLKLLIAKKFIIPFESGIVVIKHWRIHNYIQSDRKKETIYKDEASQIVLDSKTGTYELAYDPCIQDGYRMDTERIHRIGKDSIDKVSIGKDSTGEEREGKEKEKTSRGAPSAKKEKAHLTGNDMVLAERYGFTATDSLLSAYSDFVSMRKSIKKPMSERAVQMLNNKLEELASDDVDLKIAILNQSTFNCWQGVFPLKDGNVGRTQQMSMFGNETDKSRKDWQ